MSEPVFVHYKARAGVALCTVAWPGEWLSLKRAEVTCPECHRWLHA